MTDVIDFKAPPRRPRAVREKGADIVPMSGTSPEASGAADVDMAALFSEVETLIAKLAAAAAKHGRERQAMTIIETARAKLQAALYPP
jgi:hypothetical protein